MTSQVSDIQKEVGKRVNARLPSVLFDALVKQHERSGFKTGCRCKYCQEKRIVSNMRGYGIPSYYACSVNYEYYKQDRLELIRNFARNRLREVSEKELDDFA